MKTLRKQCAVVILTLILAVSAYAGQLNCPGATSGTTTGTGTTLLADVIVTVVTVIP